jgi:hypothetical protein
MLSVWSAMIVTKQHINIKPKHNCVSSIIPQLHIMHYSYYALDFPGHNVAYNL